MAFNRNNFKTTAFQAENGEIYLADISSDNDGAQCRFDSKIEANTFLTWANKLNIFSEDLFVISENDNTHIIPLATEDYFLLSSLAMQEAAQEIVEQAFDEDQEAKYDAAQDRMVLPPVRDHEDAAVAAAIYIPPDAAAAPAPVAQQWAAFENIADEINQGLADQDEARVAHTLAQIDAQLDALAAEKEEADFQHAIRLSEADQETHERLEREQLARDQYINAQQARLLEQANRLRAQGQAQQAPKPNLAQQAQQNIFKQQAEIAAQLKAQHEAQQAAAAAESKEHLKQVAEKARAEQAEKQAAKAKEEAIAKAQEAELALAAQLKAKQEAEKAEAVAERKERFLKNVAEKARVEQAEKLAAEQKIRELVEKKEAEAKAKAKAKEAELAAQLKAKQKAEQAEALLAAATAEGLLKLAAEKARAEQAQKLAAEQKIRELAEKEEKLMLAKAEEAERLAKAEEAERMAKALKEEESRQELDEAAAAGAIFHGQLNIVDEYSQYSPASSSSAVEEPNPVSSSSAVAEYSASSSSSVVNAEEEKAEQMAPVNAGALGQQATQGFLSSLATKMGIFKTTNSAGSKNTPSVVPHGEDEESEPYKYYSNDLL